MIRSHIHRHFAVVYSNEQKYFNSCFARVVCFQNICKKNFSLYNFSLSRSPSIYLSHKEMKGQISLKIQFVSVFFIRFVLFASITKLRSIFNRCHNTRISINDVDTHRMLNGSENDRKKHFVGLGFISIEISQVHSISVPLRSRD